MAENLNRPADATPLIGRDIEIKSVMDVLQRRQPALIAVEGDAGMGKTTILRAIQKRADNAGWRTIPEDIDEKMFVGRDTSQNSFLNQLSARVTYWDSSPERMASRKSGAQIGNPGYRSAVQLGLSNPTRMFEAKFIPNPVLRLLSAQSPVVLIIDGYRPNEEFANWFEAVFREDLRQLSDAVIVIVGGDPNSISRLGATADLHVKLGALDPVVLRRYLKLVGHQIRPEISETELDVYVNTLYTRPDLVGSLTRVLRLLKPKSESGSTG